MTTASIDSHAPAEVAQLVANAGASKGTMRLDKVFFSAFSAGCLLAFACGTALATNTTAWFQENAPGLIRTISALVFPYGLCLIVLTGADLCTGSFMVCFSDGSSVDILTPLCSSPLLPHSIASCRGTRCCSTGVCDLLGQPGGVSLRCGHHLWL